MKSIQRSQIEDALKHLHECEYEHQGRPASAESVAGALACNVNHALTLLQEMHKEGFIVWRDQTIVLTDSGRSYARRVIRAHRLYETFLSRQTGVRPSDWHATADVAEHEMGQKETDALADKLGHPRFDPHGDPIPTHEGTIPSILGAPLTEISVGQSVRIMHVGDEPEPLGRWLATEGFAPGMRIEVLEKDASSQKISLEGQVMRLEIPVASLLRVAVLSSSEIQEPLADRLTRLKENEEGIVLGLSPACRGAERTRLLDLGFVPGSPVRVEFTSPTGSPTAYRIRGTLIALRPQQANYIFIERKENL